jgi:vancomycin permeability regulator SanA
MEIPASRRYRLLAATCLVLLGAYLVALAGFGLVQQPRQSDLAVVLGNTVMPDGQPSPRLQARLDTAVRLVRSGTVRRILVSGGIEEPGHRDEAAVMAAYLRAKGVPTDAILVDAAGTDTMETARHAAALVKPGAGVVVVSQWFHLPRAILAMRRFGLREVSGDWPRWFEARDAYSFLREVVALPSYAIRPLS